MVVAPFTEFRYVHTPEPPEATGPSADFGHDSLDRRVTSAKQAILSMSWSWPGLLYLADPNKSAPPPLKALVNILYLSNLRIRVRAFKIQVTPVYDAVIQIPLFSRN